MKSKKSRERKQVKRTIKKQVAKAAAAAMPAKTLVIRTCRADMKSHSDFVWPRQGRVECSDWDPAPKCGNGLHGLPWGNGDWSLLSSADDAIWQVVEVETKDIVSIDNAKVKFPRGNVIYSGTRVDAIIRVLCGSEAWDYTKAAAKAWGEKCGNSSKAASSGNYSTAASSGNYSTAASSGNSSKAASSGDYSMAASSGNYSKAASSGDSGIAATIGHNGAAKAGANGLVIVTYWVEAEKRYRACVGNVGEDGIIADTWYRVEGGKLKAVAS